MTKDNKTLIVSRSHVEKFIDIKTAIQCVENAFLKHGTHQARMPAKIYLHLEEHSGDFRAMPAYLEGGASCVLKWVNVHPGNVKKGLPTVMAVLILSDPKTGFPLCIMDGTYVTSLRTGAAGAVAAKYLARKDSKVVSLVGCGEQASTQLKALYELFDIKIVKVWGHEPLLAESFIKKMNKFPLEFIPVDTLKNCVKGGDIIVTTTPSRRPLIKNEWIKKGAHINAIGADAPGKQELEFEVLKNAKVIIDDWAQASHSGEINVPIRKGLLARKDIYAELGQIIAGKKKGRINTDEITVFDSTGLAIQDLVVAELIYKTVLKKGYGRLISIV